MPASMPARDWRKPPPDLIEDGLLNESRIDDLAARLGVTDRHLRRVFQSEFGVSPVEFAQTQRLLLAKRLLTDTALPVTEVAMASGFGSLRRFNALFRDALSADALRICARHADGGRLVRCARFRNSAYRPPLEWEALLSFLDATSDRGRGTSRGRAVSAYGPRAARRKAP